MKLCFHSEKRRLTRRGGSHARRPGGDTMVSCRQSRDRNISLLPCYRRWCLIPLRVEFGGGCQEAGGAACQANSGMKDSLGRYTLDTLTNSFPHFGKFYQISHTNLMSDISPNWTRQAGRMSANWLEQTQRPGLIEKLLPLFQIRTTEIHERSKVLLHAVAGYTTFLLGTLQTVWRCGRDGMALSWQSCTGGDPCLLSPSVLFIISETGRTGQLSALENCFRHVS